MPRLRVKRARPRLEQLGARECPAVDYWVGAGDYADPNNWLDGSVPEAGVDDIVFDPALSQGSCDYGLPPPGGHPPGPIAEMGRSITMMAGYTGTVTIYTAIDLERFEQHDGSFEQYAADAHIWADEWIWSAGDLNANSPFLADINVKPGGSGQITGNDKTDGSNIKVGANAGFTVNLNAGRVIIFQKNAGIDIAAGAVFEHSRGNFATGGTGEINNAGKYYKWTPNLVNSQLPFVNTAATSEFHVGATMSFTRAGSSGVSFLQLNGLIELADGAILLVSHGLTMSDGKLHTLGQTGSGIGGNVIVHGGTIVLSQDNANKTGLLVIDGNFFMDGGEYQAKIDGSAALKRDKIAAKSITLGGGTAKLTTVSINIPAGGMPLGKEWDILEATAQNGFINGDFDTKVLDMNDGTNGSYTTTVPAGNKIYRVKS